MTDRERARKLSRLFIISGCIPFLGLLATPPTTMLFSTASSFLHAYEEKMWQRLTSREAARRFSNILQQR